MKDLPRGIRGHSPILSNLDGALDAQFKWDISTPRTGGAREFFGLVHRFAMNCFKVRTDVKGSPCSKVMHCLLDEDSMKESLNGIG